MAYGDAPDCPRCKSMNINRPMMKYLQCGNVYCAACDARGHQVMSGAKSEWRTCPCCGSTNTRQGG